MKEKRGYRKLLIVMLVCTLAGITYLSYQTFLDQIPNEIHILAGKEETFNFNLPIIAKLEPNHTDLMVAPVLQTDLKKLDQTSLHINLKQPFFISSQSEGNYKMSVSLFGLLRMKEVQVDVWTIDKLKLAGIPIGIYIETDGIMVLGTGVIKGRDGFSYEPAIHLVQSGDYITKINGVSIENKQDLIEEVQKSEGKEIKLTFRRKEEEITKVIKPIQTASGEYKLGIWIRDNTQGIGTMTYVTEDGRYGALGHGIADIDTSTLMEISDGAIYETSIMEVIKGENGKPGELVGVIKRQEDGKYGTIEKNSNQGIFGRLTQKENNLWNDKEYFPVGLKQEVKIGDAVIYCNTGDEVEEYQIKIEKIDKNSKQTSKGIVIRIVDERLLDKTNGIVQGMSGSPILQEGKIIGAVTHVFVNDSTKGYGIFIENMLEAME